jgi:leucyl aminopeptidase
MNQDKDGACTVLSAFKAIVEAKLPVNVVCTVGMVENLLGSKAYHPGDIITSHKGLTVEIGNTDAEGRLVLADCMSWTQSKHKISRMLEFSTLTGAMVMALAFTYSGLFCNSEALASKITQAANSYFVLN